MAVNAHLWITRPRPNPQAQLRLFCFPYAGGGASVFYQWLSELPWYIETCPVQLPGRENRLREPPIAQLELIVQALAQAIPPYLDMPFAFFGHSLGALTSFELARRLDPGPLHVFISAHRAPHMPNSSLPIRHLPDAEFIQQLACLKGIPQEVAQNSELLEICLPVLRADLTAYETYKYTARAPLNCPISAFGGVEDREVSREQLEAWREQTHAAFALRMFPGDHFFINSHQTLVLKAISQSLARLGTLPR